MNTDIDINIFKEFARLEDPYECARQRAKLYFLEPFKKQIYVGRIDQANADIPVLPKPSTDLSLREAKAPYELLKLETSWKVQPVSLFDTFMKQGGNDSKSIPTASLSGVRVRSVLDNHGKWDAYIYQYKREKALKSDAETPEVPRCLSWTIAEMIKWLYAIKMDKYEETFLVNEIDGSRLCDLDMNRLVKMGVKSWDDLQKITKEIKFLTKRPSQQWFYSRDTSLPPMDDVDLYLEFKNVHGEHSEITSFAQFLELNADTLWSYPEKTLRYPGMIYQNNHMKKINTNMHF